MFSLQDISTGCPEIESLSNKGEYEDDSLSIHSDGQTDNMSEEFPLDNKVNLRLKMAEDKTTENCNTTTRSNMDNHDGVSISRQADTTVSDDNSRVKLPTSTGHMGSSSEIPGGQLMKACTIASTMRESENHEAVYSPSATFNMERKTNPLDVGQEAYANDMTSRHISQPARLIEGFLDNQTSINQTVSFVPMVSKRAFLPFQDINAFSDTHRSLTSYEMSIQRKPGCNCPCHISTSPRVLASEVKIQRPSVIMVPAKRDDKISDASSKVMHSSSTQCPTYMRLRFSIRLQLSFSFKGKKRRVSLFPRLQFVFQSWLKMKGRACVPSESLLSVHIYGGLPFITTA